MGNACNDLKFGTRALNVCLHGAVITFKWVTSVTVVMIVMIVTLVRKIFAWYVNTSRAMGIALYK